MDKVDEALKVLDRVLWRSDGISPEDYADAEIARETLRDELRRLRAERDELRAALEECVEYIQRTDKVNPMEALYQGEGYSKDVLPLIGKICAILSRTEGGEVGG